MVAPRLQRRQHRQEVIFHEQHGRDHDVAVRDVALATLQRCGVTAPFGRRVNHQLQSRHRLRERAVRAFGGAREVAVHRHDDDAHRGMQRHRRASG
jgi:hypothetical protein